VVVLGAAGFVGGAIARHAEQLGETVIMLNRATVDLCSPQASEFLEEHLRTDDRLVFAAAEAPCKTLESLERNLAMVMTVIRAVSHVRVSYVMNISSDAVYLDSLEPLTETSPTGPSNLHGAMHCAREALLNSLEVPLLHLRPTLIYGKGDPHNGYGPNQFLSRARGGGEFQIFGRGEERRDHVYIADVAAVAVRCLSNRTVGALNVASGEVVSFREIAEHIVDLFAGRVRIAERARSGPMPHGGYRPISIARLRAEFSDLAPIGVKLGLTREVGEHGA
jgi:nucleoside-diphosphate-sugar epimerase